MEIIKIFNNNIVAAVTKEQKEVIVTGAGIGFQKKAGQLVETHKIEKTYVFQDGPKMRLTNSLPHIPNQYFEITNRIIEKATQELHTDFSGEAFLSISDHISFAIEREKQNTYLPNIVIGETKMLYKQEFAIGLWALDLIAEMTHVRLHDDEACYIALHLVNFSLSNTQGNATKVLSLTKEVIRLLRKILKQNIKEDSIAYARISIHLKYLAERIFSEDPANYEDTTKSIRDTLKEDARLALCINRIVKLIKERYHYELTPDEQTFLCVHIKRNMKE